jgi:hypothetical protein
MALGAIARRAGMLHFLPQDLLRFLFVAGQAKLFRRSCFQYHLSLQRRQMTSYAAVFPGFIRLMYEHQFQFRPGRLVRIVAAKAIGSGDGLPLMSLDKPGILGIMAIQAQSRSIHLELKIEFPLAPFARLVDAVADDATLIQSRVETAAFLVASTQTVARQADAVILPVIRNRLQHMAPVIRTMRVMALQAFADSGAVDTSLDATGIFITMALDAKFGSGCLLEFYTSNIIVYKDFVASKAAGFDCRMDDVPLGFFFMALQALAPIDVSLKVNNRMYPCHC